MTGRLTHCRLLILLVALLSLAFSSCRSTKKDITITDFGRLHRTDKDSGPDTTTATDNWATLDVQLTGRDNPRLYAELKTWLGVPYRYGGTTREGTDCSGLTMRVYKAVYGIDINRNSAKQFEKNCKSIPRSKLREGDLVFFITGRASKISHVGIYLKDGKFVHASSSRGVIVSDLSQNYYDKHFHCAGRVIQ